MQKVFTKEFNIWSKFKRILNGLNILIPFNEREIWWASIGTNIGVEIDGKGLDFERPVIIIKKFSNRHIIVVPISRVDNALCGIHVPLHHLGLDRRSVAVISQVRMISYKRLNRRIGILGHKQFDHLKEAVREMFL